MHPERGVEAVGLICQRRPIPEANHPYAHHLREFLDHGLQWLDLQFEEGIGGFCHVTKAPSFGRHDAEQLGRPLVFGCGASCRLGYFRW